MNVVMLVGTLDSDAKQFSESGPVNLRVATKRSWVGKDSEVKEFTDYHSVVCWRSKELMMGFKEGDLVTVQGRLKTESYDKDGEKKWVTKVDAETVTGLTAGGQPAQKRGGGVDDSEIPFMRLDERCY